MDMRYLEALKSEEQRRAMARKYKQFLKGNPDLKDTFVRELDYCCIE